MNFEAADLDRPIADVFPKATVEALAPPSLWKATEQVDFAACEHWGDRVTDDLVNGLGAFTGGVAEFKAAYERCQAQSAVMLSDDTLREWLESYRAKAHRFVPDAPLPALPVDGGDLLEFLRGFTVEQMLAYGW
jgi:hypothetical protein